MRRAALRRWCSSSAPPSEEGVQAFTKAQFKKKQRQEELETDEKLGIKKKWTDDFNMHVPRDEVKARGTQMEKITREGRMVALPDAEHVLWMEDKHPGVPDIPRPSGEWFYPKDGSMTDDVASADDIASKMDTVLGKKQSLDTNRTALREARTDRVLRDIQNKLPDIPGASTVVAPTDSPADLILPSGVGGEMKKMKAPMNEIPFDSMPPIPDYPVNTRVMTEDEFDWAMEKGEERDEATQRIYEDAFQRWKATKKLNMQRKSGLHAEEQMTEEEKAEMSKKRAEAMEEISRKNREEEDPLDVLEREMFPERFEEEEQAAKDAADKKARARIDLKPMPNALTVQLKKNIVMRGPMPLADFMKEALFNPDYGYYTTKKKVFGRDGDFITSPEVSQMFGECIAAWAVDTYHKLGSPRKFHLIEIGGGKGTLMARVLKATEAFPEFTAAVRIGMVELSPSMAEAQEETVRKECGGRVKEVRWAEDIEGLGLHDDLDPIICFSNELFDVFAVSKFQYTERGWCEWLVENDDDPEHPEHFKFVLSSGETAGSVAYIPHELRKASRENRLLGKTIELQMQGYLYLERVLDIVSRSKGAFLAFDYGVDDYVEESVRGIKDHGFVHPLSSPGEVDLSGFVSFKMLCDTVTRSEKLSSKIHVSPVMSQGEFLKRTGIEARALLHLSRTTSVRDAAKISREFATLIDEEDTSGMGTRFKAMCFSSRNPSSLVPPCPW